MSQRTEVTVGASVRLYLDEIGRTRARSTARTYRIALDRFIAALKSEGIDPGVVDTREVSEDWIALFAQTLERFAPATRNLCLTVVIGWFKMLQARGLAAVSVDRVRSLAKPHFRPVHPSPERFSFYDVSRVVTHALGLAEDQAPDEGARLRALRDRALITTLADTSLEVSTVCNLRLASIDWRKNAFVFLNRAGERVRAQFSPRAADALREYLEARSSLDDAVGGSHASLPVFAGYYRRRGQRVSPLSTRSAQNIVRQRAREALGAGHDGAVTPITFRHYHIESILRSLSLLHPRIVQRCQQLFEIGLYDEAIFNAMKVVEEEIRSISSSDATDIGAALITKAMRTKPLLIELSQVEAEQESGYLLFRGAIGSFKNPLSHRFLQTSDPVKAFERLALASLLMRMLDDAG